MNNIKTTIITYYSMIPKNIFQSWKTKYENLHPILKARIDAIKSNNPEYKYQLYDDNDIDEFVNTYYPGEIADCYNKLYINSLLDKYYLKTETYDHNDN
jgi:mannosyltransferase OCH1-like enzyme